MLEYEMKPGAELGGRGEGEQGEGEERVKAGAATDLRFISAQVN